MNPAQRSVTPDSFSEGTTAITSSGYFAFQSCAWAAVPSANVAASATSSVRRVVMKTSSGVVAEDFGT
jgi:hypothetical protein